jgi:hypothetical protein
MRVHMKRNIVRLQGSVSISVRIEPMPKYPSSIEIIIEAPTAAR